MRKQPTRVCEIANGPGVGGRLRLGGDKAEASQRLLLGGIVARLRAPQGGPGGGK